MGFLTHKLERSEIAAGDHIYSWRTAFIYSHHGRSPNSFACFCVFAWLFLLWPLRLAFVPFSCFCSRFDRFLRGF
ncbi:hypothetical protein ACJIZ3_021297 [Penstemon smallii]|uniref:Uncharacterized protein n=1 Tax=Penstemon smallii TaxID=265156 RepID=A0ABD3SM07_9LAMI